MLAKTVAGGLTLCSSVYPVAWILLGFTGIADDLSSRATDRLDILFAVTVVIQVGLIPFYIYRVSRRSDIAAKASWILGFLLTPSVSMPFFFIRYELRGAEQAPVDGVP